MTTRPIYKLLPAILAAAAVASAQGQSAPRIHDVPATDQPIEIDGRLDDPAWQNAAEIPLAYETEPAENIPAPIRTELLLTYDQDRLYIAFRAHDPEPDSIRARLADRDSAFSDDFVGVSLDTFNDGRRAFEFFANPLGVQMDATYDDLREDEDTSWDAIWSSAGRLTSTGYAVEMAVPFSSLRFPRTRGPQTWGIDALRRRPRTDSQRLAIHPRDRDIDCYVCQFSKIRGFEGITPGRNLEINPTLTAGATEAREDFPSGDFGDSDETSDVGLTVSWGVTPNLNFSGTVNPDFSQVEADVAQLDVNTQFALFFPERRPFFLEDADLFNTPLRAVFTRNVADPAWGTRLTGKAGKHAFGFFVADDEITNLIFPGNQGSNAGSFDFETSDAVARYRRDFGSNSAVGVLLTRREGDGYSNLVAGVDGLIRFSGSDSLSFQVLESRTEYPSAIAAAFDQPEGSFDDRALTMTYVHADRDWRWWAVYEDIGDGFRADMGFLPKVGIVHPRGGIQRTWWGDEDDWYNEIRFGGNFDRVEDQNGQRLEQTWETWFNVEGPLQSEFEIQLSKRDRFFNGVDFEENSLWTSFEIRPNKQLELELEVEVGDQVDFANTRLGDLLVVSPEIRLDVGRHLRAFFEHELRRLDVDGGRLFEANLTQARFLYQFNLRTFVRAVFQYTDIVRDPSLFVDPVDPESEQLFTQLLFSYKLNPRTVLFLGYSDNHRAEDSFGLTQEDRTLFLKIGYAWVL